jgi:hypothetical protein
VTASTRLIVRRPDGEDRRVPPAEIAELVTGGRGGAGLECANIAGPSSTPSSPPTAAAANTDAPEERASDLLSDPLAIMAQAMPGSDESRRSVRTQPDTGPRPALASVRQQREDEDENENLPPAKQLIQLVMESGAELFHSPDGEPFLSISGGQYRETRAVGAKRSDFREWLSGLYYRNTGQVASEAAISEAASVLTGRAKYDGPEHRVHVRVAEHEGCIYVDLANNAWQAVKISPDGWTVVDLPPVRFIRPPGMKALPEPVPGGSVDELRPLINIGGNDQWVLLVSWIVAAYRPRGPYPPLIIEGPQGSTKSSLTKVLRSLTDPNTAEKRSLPKNEHHLMISAKSSWLMEFDNVSGIPDWLSDAFCRLSTGGAFSTRRYYSDDSERLFEASRPILINGIDVNATRGDLLDRAIILTLLQIAPTVRRAEQDFWREVETVLPRVLGAIFTVIAGALRALPEVRLEGLPRMADFAIWATAAEQALGWPTGTFMDAYNRNRAAATDLALESFALLPSIESLLASQGSFTGRATELLDALRQTDVNNHTTSTKGWPSDGRGLSEKLTRFQLHLMSLGIDIRFEQTAGSRSKKLITLSRSGNSPVPGPASHASQASHVPSGSTPE